MLTPCACTIAQALGATQVAGIATAVFRRAGNGEAYLARANGELGMKLQIVSQQLEGQLGFLAASSGVAAHEKDSLVAWDSGGGSFQISARVDDEVRVWEGPIGDSNVTAALLGVQGKRFEGSSHGQRTSPNPVSAAEAKALMTMLDEEMLPPAPEWLRRRLASPQCRLVGFGERTSIFSLAASLCDGPETLTPAAVWSAAERCLGCGDAELCDKYGPLHEEEDLVVPKLVLLHTVLTRRLEGATLRNVHTMGNAEGVAICEELWQ